MWVSIQIQCSFKQNGITGKDNTGQKKTVPSSSKQNHWTQPSNRIKNNNKKTYTHKSVAFTLHYKTWGWKYKANWYPVHKSLWPPRLGGMFNHQLLLLGSLTDAPIMKVFVFCIKTTKGQNTAMSALISSDPSSQSQPSATRQDSLEQGTQSQKV